METTTDTRNPQRFLSAPRRLALAALLALAAAGVGCREASTDDTAASTPPAATPADQPATSVEAPLAATAALGSDAAQQVAGTVRFDQVGEEVVVTAHLTGLSPGEHGFHIHETGDCSVPGFESAGGHFNPANAPHGGPTSEAHHAGDLGNLTATEQGEAHVDARSTAITLRTGDRSIVRRAVIVHQGPDQFAVQPDGAAGTRIACGVIELVPTS